MPIVLVATGLAWLMGASARSSSATQSFGHTRFDSGNDSSDGIGAKARELKDAASSKLGSMADKAREMQSNAAGQIQGARDGLASSAEQTSNRASQLARSGRDGLATVQDDIDRRLHQGRDVASRVADRTATLYREQPVALGIAGLALGAIVGALLPPTRREDELLGAHRDQLKEQAEQTVSTQFESAKQMAAEKAKDASDKALQSIDELKTK